MARKKATTPEPAPEVAETAVLQDTDTTPEATAPETPAPEVPPPANEPEDTTPPPEPTPPTPPEPEQEPAGERPTPYRAKVAVSIAVLHKAVGLGTADMLKPVGSLRQGAAVTVTGRRGPYAQLKNGLWMKEAFLAV